MPESPDPTQLANQPFAAAMRRARLLSNLTLDDWAGRLSENGAPASRNQAWKWEHGETIVPAYALEAARRAIGRGLGELMGGEEPDPLAKRLDELEARYEQLVVERGDRLDTLETLVFEIRALPEIAAAIHAEAGRREAKAGGDTVA